MESKKNVSSSKNKKRNWNEVGRENLGGLVQPSETDLEELAADVDSLLGRGWENECCGMEELGLLDCSREKETTTSESKCLGSGRAVKEEEEEEGSGGLVGMEEVEMMREPFELNFEDYDDSGGGSCEEKVDVKKRNMVLKLDYDAVVAAWGDSQRSPWASGDRPDFGSDDCLGICGGGEINQNHHQNGYGYGYGYGELMNGIGGGGGGNSALMGDGGREARVSRYREKRRTRLFSKKIRYEVRKLNAEKRPRMKGRFVKRPLSSFASSPPAFPA